MTATRSGSEMVSELGAIRLALLTWRRRPRPGSILASSTLRPNGIAAAHAGLEIRARLSLSCHGVGPSAVFENDNRAVHSNEPT